MDYEKKYKEALERAREIHNEHRAQCFDVMVKLFPELKESKDERIRKALINVFSTHQGYEVFFGASVENILAWLEKQKDASESYQLGYTEGMRVKNKEWLEKQGEKSNIHQDAEDDLRRQHTIRVLEYARSLDAYNQYGKESINKDIAWLEKQGKPKEKPTKEQVWDYCNKISSEWWQITMDRWNTLTDEDKNKYNQFIGFNDFSDTLMNITAGALFQLIDTGKLEYEEGSLLLEKPDDTPKPLEIINVMNEKQGKRKPADEVEPKFKVGDWIINPKTRNVLQIKNILLCGNKGNYEFDNSSMPIGSVDGHYKQWTIQDAKDGDVLLFEGCYYNSIILFQGIGINGKGRINYHCKCDLGNYSFGIQGDVACLGTIEKDAEHYHPATKEQRDLLFQKLKEAGYEWNAEKKELKKIVARKNLTLDGDLMQADCMIVEQKPTWSEEDEEMIDAVIADIRFTQTEHNHEVCQIVYEREIDWLKSIKERMKGE